MVTYYGSGLMTLPVVVPSSNVVGPTLGAQSVRDNAGARTVTDPGGGISFTSPSDLQTKINANAVGTIFVAASGFTWTTQVDTGTTKAPKIYIPTGRVMNLNSFAGTGLIIRSGELHGGEWINAGAEQAPVTMEGVPPLGTGPQKLVQDAIFHNNFGKGFNIGASNSTFDHCTTYSNGRYGFGTNQSAAQGAGSYNTNVRFQYIKCYSNNTRSLNPSGDAGGNKLLHAVDCYVGFSWFYSNTGAGLWFDFNPGAHIVEECVMENNTQWGFFYEMGSSYPGGPWSSLANIHNNYFKDNCTIDNNSWTDAVQLLSSCSDGQINGGTGYDFHHNIIDGTTPRAVGFVDGDWHPNDVKSCRIHDNEIYIRSTSLGRVGGHDADAVADPFSVAAGNTFENNHYHVQNDTLAYFRWQGADKTWSQWNALGHDNTGTIDEAVAAFGPTLGAQAIRDGAGARAVSDPGGAIAFTSASDLQTKINANAAGTKFVAANSMDWAVSVDTGSKAPKIWVPTGRVMDGGARNIIGLVVKDGAEVHGGTWQNFGSVSGQNFHKPLITANTVGDVKTGPPKLVQDIVCVNNYQTGFGNQGSNVTFDHCTTHSNGRYGLGTTEFSVGSFFNINVKFQYIECYNNNTRNESYADDAGGNKLLSTLDTYVGFSWFYNNKGAGLWMDYNPGAHLVEQNVIENNERWGFFYEVGTGDPSLNHKAEIECRNNFIKDNVTIDGNSWYNSVELLSSCSDGQLHGGTGYEFHHNIVDTTHRAMGFVDHTSHPFDVKSCLFRDNDVWLRGTRTGCVGGQFYNGGTYPISDPYSVASNNHFSGNHYHVAVGQTTAAKWRWQSADKTWAQWQALGHDTNASGATLVTY